MNLEKYKCDGQLSIFDIKASRLKELQEKYPIPDVPEIASKEWHYTEIEQPTETGVYWCICEIPNSIYWNYIYMAYTDRWWRYDDWQHKWKRTNVGYFADLDPIAWAEIPAIQLRRDGHLQTEAGLLGLAGII